MALARNPSFLKRQKEQQRNARAARKREERAARKQARADGQPDEEFGSLADLGIEPLPGAPAPMSPDEGQDDSGDDSRG